ncbi:zinc-specific metallo-regulatory protein [Desulfosporosinus acididurans]|uniref:Zinc-specific metallo-regulatory protein n=1 Tax=Desulfosporosinus acididurans TaxID=476652 RepID=A0A0J1FJP4_9FIRM|nr:transcriptional repressor [Desulfosporosinus acididurans]KLU63655.1 zinc-specific metallo-regulatory protein [Desulfosporosinus acididurans]
MELELIKSKLHESNFRLTQEREVVLTTFMNSGQMLTPAQLHDCVKKEYNSVGLTTVYRLIEVLTKLGLATPFLIDGEIYYTFCSDHHHHHFVCLDCHKVKDIYECLEMTHKYDDVGTVNYHRMDLYGHCKNCERKNINVKSLEP